MVPILPTVHFRHNKNHVGYVIQQDVVWRGICIPEGFTYDGATVPQIFWALTGGPYHPRGMKAALVHDWLYMTQLLPQAEADSILAELLKEWGTHHWKVEAFYKSVSTFGRNFYKWTAQDLEHIAHHIERLRARGINPEKFRLITVYENAFQSLLNKE